MRVGQPELAEGEDAGLEPEAEQKESEEAEERQSAGQADLAAVSARDSPNR